MIQIITIHGFPAFGASIAAIDREPFDFVEDFPLYSRVYICPHCKTQWGHIQTCTDWSTFCYSATGSYRIEVFSCARCFRPTAMHPVPGSLLDHDLGDRIDWPLLALMPEGLVRRELDLTLKAFPCP